LITSIQEALLSLMLGERVNRRLPRRVFELSKLAWPAGMLRRDLHILERDGEASSRRRHARDTLTAGSGGGSSPGLRADPVGGSGCCKPLILPALASSSLSWAGRDTLRAASTISLLPMNRLLRLDEPPSLLQRGIALTIGGLDEHIHLLTDEERRVALCEAVDDLESAAIHTFRDSPGQ
jgi:hypothetical protein